MTAKSGDWRPLPQTWTAADVLLCSHIACHREWTWQSEGDCRSPSGTPVSSDEQCIPEMFAAGKIVCHRAGV